MPIRDEAAMNASLDNDYGTTAGPNAAAEHLMALYTGDPRLAAPEVTGDGYTRTVVQPADWDPAVGGRKTTVVTMLPPSGDWDSATWWGLLDAADPDVMWDCAPLADPLDVTGASTDGPIITITVFYNNSLEA